MAYGKNTLIDNTKYFTEEKLQENRATFLKLLRLVERPGIEELIAYLENTDFFKAPASTFHHLGCEGGLVQHLLNVCKCLNIKVKQFNLDIPKESVIITSLLHDFAKINQYTVAKKVFKNDGLDKYADNKWYDYMTYSYTNENSIPLPHETKSIVMIQRFINLTDDEIVAIQYHHGAFNEGWKTNGLNDGFKNCKLAVLLHLSDMEATHLLEPVIDHKELPQARHERLIEETRRLSEMELNKNQNK